MLKKYLAATARDGGGHERGVPPQDGTAVQAGAQIPRRRPSQEDHSERW